MKKISILLSVSILFTFVALAGFSADAQVQSADIVLNISPENPNPNQNVTAILSSHVIDLDKANISWLVNNQQKNGGIGKKSFSFNTGEFGSSIVLSAVVDTIDGQSVSKTLMITPGEVDMLWEANDSYAPPFYRGKTLVGSQGIFRVVAMPSLANQSGKVNANNLSYAWTKDGKAQTDSSGWGKNYFVFQNSYLDKDNTVEVKVSDISGGANVSGKITLKTTNPKIFFYKNDPSLGTLWEKTLNNGFTINSNGETFVAEPYFFSPKNIDSSSMAFDWFLNGEKIQTPSPKNVLALKPESGQSGSGTIKVVVNNINTLFQSMEKQIQVSF